VKVFVASTGIISAIGFNTEENIASLQQLRSGIGENTLMKTRHTFPVGEVKMDNETLAAKAGLDKHWTRTALLSVIAAQEAVAKFGLDLHRFKTGFISANTVGGMDKTEYFFNDYYFDHKKGKLRDVIHHDSGSPTELVADALGIKDYITTISTACSSSANAIMFAARLIKSGKIDVAAAGGCDALTKFTLNGFNTLMILDPEPCKPFDENRKGLNLGEGAGYVVLVSEKIAKENSLNIICELSGYANANDAFHQTASSPEGNGSYLAMKNALKLSNLQPADIDYINLHGTGTQNNDSSEGNAIRRIFSENIPAVSSTKSFTGHTLGACGGIEAALSALAVKHNYIYPNLRFSEPIKDLNIIPETTFIQNKTVRNAVSNSFGFGGNCTSLIFSKV
jgi:3-oxoacyl-(acyl-carrier-protein) synthase